MTPSNPRERPLTPKQEQFCVDIAAGMPPRDAFLKSYSWTGSEGALIVEVRRQTAHPRLAARIQALRDMYATRVMEGSRGKPSEEAAPAYGVKEAMDELGKGMALAISKENPAAVAKIVEVKMKLYGLGISDAKNPSDKESLPPEELERMLSDLRKWREAKRG